MKYPSKPTTVLELLLQDHGDGGGQRVDPVTGSEVENTEDVTEPSGGGDDPVNMEG